MITTYAVMCIHQIFNVLIFLHMIVASAHAYAHMNGRRNYLLMFMFMPCANSGSPLLVVKMSGLTAFEATHAKLGYRYSSVPYG